MEHSIFEWIGMILAFIIALHFFTKNQWQFSVVEPALSSREPIPTAPSQQRDARICPADGENPLLEMSYQGCIQRLSEWQRVNEYTADGLFAVISKSSAAEKISFLQKSETQEELHYLRNRFGCLGRWVALDGSWDTSKLDIGWIKIFWPHFDTISRFYLQLWESCGQGKDLGYLAGLLAVLAALEKLIRDLDQRWEEGRQRMQQQEQHLLEQRRLQEQERQQQEQQRMLEHQRLQDQARLHEDQRLQEERQRQQAAQQQQAPSPQPGPNPQPSTAPSQETGPTPTSPATTVALDPQWKVQRESPAPSDTPFDNLTHAQSLQLIGHWFYCTENLARTVKNELSVCKKKVKNVEAISAYVGRAQFKQKMEVIESRFQHAQGYLNGDAASAQQKEGAKARGLDIWGVVNDIYNFAQYATGETPELDSAHQCARVVAGLQ